MIRDMPHLANFVYDMYTDKIKALRREQRVMFYSFYLLMFDFLTKILIMIGHTNNTKAMTVLLCCFADLPPTENYA